MHGQGFLHDNPLNVILLGVSTAIFSAGESKADDDMKDASIDLLEALAAVINSSRLMKEVDIQNQINDLLE
jgi:hypothetical protein